MKNFVLCILSILFFFYPCILTNAGDLNGYEEENIIFLLDSSQSMSEVDKDYQALEFIKEFISVVPGYCQVGIVIYNQEICVSLPPGSSREEIEAALSEVAYQNYGNAGAGLERAVSLLTGNRSEKRIIFISDGENLMKSEEATEESAALFEKAQKEAESQEIAVDIINLGERIGDRTNIYSAAEATDGKIYDLENGEAFEKFAEKYLFEELEIANRPVGKISGTAGKLEIKLPDCLMEKAKIILLGKQQNENLTVNCEAEKMQVLKGSGYTVLELEYPVSGDIAVQINSEENMDINAFLMAEYEFEAEAYCEYLSDTGQAQIDIKLKNKKGRSLLSGHLADNGLSVFLNGNECGYIVKDDKLTVEKPAFENETVELTLQFPDSFGIYYGNKELKAEILLPAAEEEKETDWFFITVIAVFAAALILIFLMAGKTKKTAVHQRNMLEESRLLPKESGVQGNDFYGKLLVYVIHNRDDIDYPPESINLFARCSREVITLEWILDACNLPLSLKGAEKVMIKPGDDRSLIIKNTGKAAAMKGRELMIKGRSYHLYYHEKVTFIFDQEDTEIEVHYKDLKPNERQGR